MTETLPDLPLWLSLALAALLLSGSLFAFIGAAGLAAFRNFYDRLHMPSLGTTIGAALLLSAPMLYASCRAGRPVLRDALILFFLSLSAPLSLMMLSRAAAMRDFTKSWSDSSDNMFWQLARSHKETRKTDEQTDKEEAREERDMARKEETGPQSAPNPRAKAGSGEESASADAPPLPQKKRRAQAAPRPKRKKAAAAKPAEK